MQANRMLDVSSTALPVERASMNLELFNRTKSILLKNHPSNHIPSIVTEFERWSAKLDRSQLAELFIRFYLKDTTRLQEYIDLIEHIEQDNRRWF